MSAQKASFDCIKYIITRKVNFLGQTFQKKGMHHPLFSAPFQMGSTKECFFQLYIASFRATGTSLDQKNLSSCDQPGFNGFQTPINGIQFNFRKESPSVLFICGSSQFGIRFISFIHFLYLLSYSCDSVLSYLSLLVYKDVMYFHCHQLVQILFAQKRQ